jgi:hypothetical protein
MARTHFSGPVVTSNFGAVTQITTAATAVICNSAAGVITTVTQNIAAAGEVQFTVTCDKCKATDVPNVAIRSGTVGGTTIASVTAVADGSFQITLSNEHATVAETGVLLINYVILGANV